MITLGIETSCDETAVALVDDALRVRAQLVRSQLADHAPHGGVVPELASRAHLEALPEMLPRVLAEAGCDWADVGQIAVTTGPGLASSLLIGVVFAKALARTLDKPLIAVNHIEAHLLACFLGDGRPAPAAACPALALIVSGGHTSLIRMDAPGSYRLLGRTMDDAAGEALDKGAKILGLGYPGGPILEKLARTGREDFLPFPRGRVTEIFGGGGAGLRPECCFSYSGLKTALRYALRDHPEWIAPPRLADMAASYQRAVLDALLDRADNALDTAADWRTLLLGGGVARNARLREGLAALAARRGLPLLAAEPDYCTDNAAMVAAVAAAGLGGTPPNPAELDVTPNFDGWGPLVPGTKNLVPGTKNKKSSG